MATLPIAGAIRLDDDDVLIYADDSRLGVGETLDLLQDYQVRLVDYGVEGREVMLQVTHDDEVVHDQILPRGETMTYTREIDGEEESLVQVEYLGPVEAPMFTRARLRVVQVKDPSLPLNREILLENKKMTLRSNNQTPLAAGYTIQASNIYEADGADRVDITLRKNGEVVEQRERVKTGDFFNYFQDGRVVLVFQVDTLFKATSGHLIFIDHLTQLQEPTVEAHPDEDAPGISISISEHPREDREINVTISVRGPSVRGPIDSITVLVDGAARASIDSVEPENTIALDSLDAGQHTITVVASTPNGTLTESTSFNVEPADETPERTPPVVVREISGFTGPVAVVLLCTAYLILRKP